MKILGPLFFAILFVVFFKAQQFMAPSQEGSQSIKILAYSSFVSHFGPAQDIKKSFEAQTGCRISYEDVGDAGLLLNKLRLDQDVDVVVGLDQLSLYQAKKLFEWRPVDWGRNSVFEAIENVTVDPFVPFDWAPLSFAYRPSQTDKKGNQVHWKNQAFLTRPDKILKVTIPDPKYSTTGAQFVYWFSKKNKWSSILDVKKNLSSHVKFYADWSQSYGLFLRHQANVTWTQMTSRAYHEEQGDMDIEFINFEKPHPYQVEFAGVPLTCRQCLCAEKFVKHLLSDQVQNILQQKNYMMPVSKKVNLRSSYHSLMTLPLMKYDGAHSLSDFVDEIDLSW